MSSIKHIKQLDQKTIDLISAGEVIESPADILKELLDNSIDSKADNIQINIKNSGVDLIEVVDNGNGIYKEDLEICTKKYTTSKLKSIEDLYLTNSLGFRGEALSTIKAVSNLEIKSCVDDTGKAYVLDSNQELKASSGTKGTRVTVKDLFYNLPVRKKFLKSKSSEFSKLYLVFLNFVILYPNIKFTFTSERKNEVYPKTNLNKRYQQVFGKDILEKSISISIDNQLFQLKGLIGKANAYFYNPNNFIFINNRPVAFPKIKNILKQVYDDYLMVQQKPFFVFFLTIDQKTIDINVHPKKKIIKLQNELLFLEELKKELIKEFNNHNQVKVKEYTKSNYNLNQNKLNTNFTTTNSNSFYNSNNKLSSNFKLPNNSNFKDSYNTQKYFENSNFEKSNSQNHSLDSLNINKYPLCLANHEIIKILGQIKKTYIVCETKEGLLLIDQHASAERINLEINRNNLKLDSQKLITPINLSKVISEEQYVFIINNKKIFENIGFYFKLEDVEDSKILLISTPVIIGNNISPHIICNLIEDMTNNPKDLFKPIMDKVIKLKSCKQSLKSNQELTLPQMYSLIKDLEKCKDKTICAHGRPTMVFFNNKDLEKMFKRII